MIRRSEYAPAGLVSCLGLMVLTLLTLAPRDADANVGIVFPPWITREQALVTVAALDLPIVDIRWNGRLFVVVRPVGANTALWPLPASALLVNAIATGLCNDAIASSVAPFREATQ